MKRTAWLAGILFAGILLSLMAGCGGSPKPVEQKPQETRQKPESVFVASSGGNGKYEDWITRSVAAKDGSFVVLAETGEFPVVWDMASKKKVRTLPGVRTRFWAMGISEDDCKVAGAGLRVGYVWEVESGTLVCTLRGHRDEIWGIEFIEQDTKIVTASKDSTIRVWDAQSGDLLKTIQTRRPIRSMAVVDDKHVVVGNSFRERTPTSVCLWNIDTGFKIFEAPGHQDIITGLAASNDGRFIASGSADGTCRLWDAQTGKEVRRFIGQGGWSERVAFSRSGTYLLSAGEVPDATVCAWDYNTGQMVWKSDRSYHGLLGLIPITEGGSDSVITTGKDGRVRCWKVLAEDDRYPSDIKAVEDQLATLVIRIRRSIEAGDTTNALVLSESKLELHRQLFDVYPLDYAAGLVEVGTLQKTLKHYAESEASLLEAVEIQNHFLGWWRPPTRATNKELGLVYAFLGDEEKSKQYTDEANR